MEFLSHFRVLLQRFDAETCDDEETSNENSETTSFITQLATWQKQVLYTMYCIRKGTIFLRLEHVFSLYFRYYHPPLYSLSYTNT